MRSQFHAAGRCCVSCPFQVPQAVTPAPLAAARRLHLLGALVPLHTIRATTCHHFMRMWLLRLACDAPAASSSSIHVAVVSSWLCLNYVPTALLTSFSDARHSTRTGGGALSIGADGPRLEARRSATWYRGGRFLPDGRTVRALGPDGLRVCRGRRRSPTAPGSCSREGPRRGG
jgi:hypothetical protein